MESPFIRAPYCCLAFLPLGILHFLLATSSLLRSKQLLDFSHFSGLGAILVAKEKTFGYLGPPVVPFSPLFWGRVPY